MNTVITSFDEADLNGFVDGRIEPTRAAALAESLAGDSDARARIDGWKRQNETLRTLFASVLFEPVPVRLSPTTLDAEGIAPRASASLPASSADAPLRTPKPQERRDRFSSRTLGVVITTSVGMALVGFVAGALTSLGTNGFGFVSFGTHDAASPRALQVPSDRAFAIRAAETHQTFLTDPIKPVEISAAESPRLQRWLQHRLAAAIRIPDLQRQGWGLIGGRIVPGANGPAAFMVYGNGSDRLGLYIARTSALAADGSFSVAGSSPTSVNAWSDDAFGYALTTSRTVQWLDGNAATLRDAIQTQVRDGLSAD